MGQLAVFRGKYAYTIVIPAAYDVFSRLWEEERQAG
jgi:hypothetical protein